MLYWFWRKSHPVSQGWGVQAPDSTSSVLPIPMGHLDSETAEDGGCGWQTSQKVDLARLPPCYAALKPHFQRVNHCVYKRADEAIVEKPKPYDGQGWLKTEGLLTPVWSCPTNLTGWYPWDWRSWTRRRRDWIGGRVWTWWLINVIVHSFCMVQASERGRLDTTMLLKHLWNKYCNVYILFCYSILLYTIVHLLENVILCVVGYAIQYKACFKTLSWHSTFSTIVGFCKTILNIPFSPIWGIVQNLWLQKE